MNDLARLKIHRRQVLGFNALVIQAHVHTNGRLHHQPMTANNTPMV